MNLLVGNYINYKTIAMKTTSGNFIYYKFECDDKNLPSNFLSDVCFSLSQYDKAIQFKNELDSNGLNYTFLLERFDGLNDQIISRDYFVDNNCLNQ